MRVGDCSDAMLGKLTQTERALVKAHQGAVLKAHAKGAPVHVSHHSVGHECEWGGTDARGWGIGRGHGRREPVREPLCSRTGKCRQYRVMRTMSESMQVPANDVRCCKLADETWVPTEWHARVYEDAGCPDVHVLGEAVDSDALFVPRTSDEIEARGAASSARPFRFLSNFRWTERKGYGALLRAYWEEFGAGDNVELYLRTYMAPWDVIQYSTVGAEMDAIMKSMGLDEASAAAATVLDGELDRSGLAAMYRAADAFVLPSRGEGWGLPAMEAMMSGLPAIVTNFSGFTGFCDARTAYAMVDVAVDRTSSDAEPSIAELRSAMRSLYELGPSGAASAGARLSAELRRHWSPARLAVALTERLEGAFSRLTARRLAEAEAGIARGEALPTKVLEAIDAASESGVTRSSDVADADGSGAGGSADSLRQLPRTHADKEHFRGRISKLRRARESERHNIGVGSQGNAAMSAERAAAAKAHDADALFAEVLARSRANDLIPLAANAKHKRGSHNTKISPTVL